MLRHKSLVLPALLLLLVLCSSVCLANTIYVKTSGKDSNSGTSWSSAKRTIQCAIDACEGGEVWVAKGTYYGCIDLRGGVCLYGGFCGSEKSIKERNLSKNLTILDGKGGGPVVTGYACEALLNGLIIRNGRAQLEGGAICCYYSNLWVECCTIVKNQAGMCGGGIYADKCMVQILDSTICENKVSNWQEASKGGGICLLDCCGCIEENLITKNAACASYECARGAGIYAECYDMLITCNQIECNYCAFYPDVNPDPDRLASGGGI